MRMLRSLWAPVVTALLAAVITSSAQAQARTQALQAESDYGVALALQGRTAPAESVFISLLSHSPRDARALNNLGNLALLRDDLGLALSFYDRAREGDSMDAGILLNEATVWMLAGEVEMAQSAAARGISQAGGLTQAAKLLGVTSADAMATLAKGDRRSFLDKEEVLVLLRLAAGKVPSDTVKTAPHPEPRRGVAWRSAGARGADPDESSAALVYWKRQ